jgi:hypothetical protein
MQGRVTADDHATGYSDLPITCNAELIAHVGATGGYKVERYVDAAGHECAYYDSSLIAGLGALEGGIGVFVLDMADPAHPVQTAQLITPAMLSPHESLLVNQERGLLAAVMGNPVVAPGVIDVYDLEPDCRQPTLRPPFGIGLLGHESGWTDDGNTFFATSLITGNTTAVDLSDGALPLPLWSGNYSSHGLSLSADGNRGYLAARTGVPGAANPTNDAGLIIIDTSQVQARVPNPQVPVVGTLTWPDVSVPQNAMPMTIGGHPYLLEVDEFASGDFGFPGNQPGNPVGAARIIDIADETAPFVLSTLKLAVHLPENRAEVFGDPGADFPIGGYSAHYCGVPRMADPGIVACSMILSGLRVFDVRDPANPREIAYFNPAGLPEAGDPGADAMTMSRPAFVPARNEIWFADGNSGFYVIRLTNGAWNPAPAPAMPVEVTAPSVASAADTGGPLPATGPRGVAVGLAVLLLVAAMVGRRLSRRA